MSLMNFFTGHWTWLQLLREIGPLVAASCGAYVAGYWRGRVIEQQCSGEAARVSRIVQLARIIQESGIPANEFARAYNAYEPSAGETGAAK